MATFGPNGADAITSGTVVTAALGYTPTSNTIGSFYVDGDPNTFYPVVFFGGGSLGCRIQITKHVHTYQTWDGICDIEIYWANRGWGGYLGYTAVRRNRFSSRPYLASIATASPVGDALILWMRGSRSYEYRTDIPLQSPSVYTTNLPVELGAPPTYSYTYNSRTTVDDFFNLQTVGDYQQYSRVDANGMVLAPYNTTFCYYKSGAQYYPNTTDGNSGSAITLTGWTALENTNGNFNPSTGVFTAPVAGRYFFSVSLMLNAQRTDNDQQTRWYKNGAYYVGSNHVFSTVYNQLNVSCVVYLAANETMECRIYGSGVKGCYVYSDRYSNISGFLLG